MPTCQQRSWCVFCFHFVFGRGKKPTTKLNNPQHSKPPKSWNTSCRNEFLQDWPQHTKVNPSCFCWYSCRQGQEALNAGLAVSSGSLLGWAGYRCLCCLRVTAVVALSHREKKLWGNHSSAQGNQAVSFCLELQCKCVDSPPFFIYQEMLSTIDSNFLYQNPPCPQFVLFSRSEHFHNPIRDFGSV